MTVESSSKEEPSRMPTISSTESSEFVMSDLPMSEEGLPSPAPLATTESSPSIHLSQWAPETDISYESSQLQPTPLTQSLQIQDGHDTSFKTDYHYFGSIDPSSVTVPTPPLPATVIETVISPSSGPTPLSLSHVYGIFVLVSYTIVGF
ncbi:hypothetical protein EV363DRAFT_1473396 [Boletus edulis]|nr:hypothetical protein EV363DRAFT_1473396 [Boletus edulis]